MEHAAALINVSVSKSGVNSGRISRIAWLPVSFVQVLSRDIRSLHQRMAVAPVAGKPQQQEQQQQVASQGPPSPSPRPQHQQADVFSSQEAGASDAAVPSPQQQQQQQDQGQSEGAAESAEQSQQQSPQYTVTLDGVVISYTINPASGQVTVSGAAPVKALDNGV